MLKMVNFHNGYNIWKPIVHKVFIGEAMWCLHHVARPWNCGCRHFKWMPIIISCKAISEIVNFGNGRPYRALFQTFHPSYDKISKFCLPFTHNIPSFGVDSQHENIPRVMVDLNINRRPSWIWRPFWITLHLNPFSGETIYHIWYNEQVFLHL